MWSKSDALSRLSVQLYQILQPLPSYSVINSNVALIKAAVPLLQFLYVCYEIDGNMMPVKCVFQRILHVTVCR